MEPLSRNHTPLPPAEAMSPTFVPAEITTPDAAPVWDRVVLFDGRPVSDRPVDGRVSLAETVPRAPKSLPQRDPASLAIAEAIAPGTRLVRSASTAHVFHDLSVPRAVTTDWALEPVTSAAAEALRDGASPPSEPEVILPASKPVMRELGLKYEIVDRTTGDRSGNGLDDAYLAYYRMRHARKHGM